MRDFDEIQQSIDNSFQEFIAKMLRLNGQRLKYYYWTTDFFEIVGGLSFRYFHLSQNQKENINTNGKIYFDDDELSFEINKNSHRHDITIRNIVKLFKEDNKSGQSNRYEYLKEFILWQILNEMGNAKQDIPIHVIEQQKNNFLITYLNYLIEFTKKPSFPEFSSYIKYNLTFQGEELDKKIKELEDKGIQNLKLKTKLDRLYVHKDEQSKIHFVFSRNGGAEKEELRELLDVMSKDDTGKLYRGQANSTWTLDSSLTREPKYVENEAEMYYDILSQKPDAFINDHTVYDRLITMQHYGMPTRLMDITRNPLVSIFFACNNLQRADSDGVVYTFSNDAKKILNFEDPKLEGLKKLFDKSNGVFNEQEKDFLSSISFIKGVAKNQRISNQSGDFIFVGSGENIAKELNDLPTMSIIIDASTKKILLEQLESLNIHGGSVYPDLTHMSNYIRNKFLNDKTYTRGEFEKIEVVKDESLVKKEKNKYKRLTESEALIRFDQMIGKNQKEKEVRMLVNNFDKIDFWTTQRTTKVKAFVKKEKLHEDDFFQVLNSYYEDDRLPARSEISKIMEVKPSLKDLKLIIDPLIEKIEKLAVILKNTPVKK